MRGIRIFSRVNSDGVKELYIFRALLVRFHTKKLSIVAINLTNLKGSMILKLLHITNIYIYIYIYEEVK